MYQNYRLFKISFLTLCFFCWGCQQEELQPIQKEPEQGIFFKEWTYQEFTSIPAITNFLKGKKNGEFSSKITEIGSNGLEMEYDFHIDHSRVVEIQNRGITSFTMAIKRDYETAGYFENLMIDIDSSQTVHAYIVKYIPHEEVQDVPVHESFSFRGEISVVPIEFLGSIGKYQKNHQKASETICGSTPILICSYGSYDHIAGDECIKQEARTNDGRVTTVWIPNDCNDGGGVLYDGSSYPTNEGVHESGSDGSSTGTTTPILNEDDDAATALTNILEITNQRTIDWLNSNLSKAQEICDFLNANNQSEEAKTFANAAITAEMNGGEVDFQGRLIYNPLTANQIKSRMSPSEAAMFENLNTIQQSLYLKAATEAYTYAEIFYPRPVRNRIGDAIKHSLWNALSTRYIGANLTKLLTDAHEEIDYDPNYSNHYKETEMDLFNNRVGRQLAQSTGFIFYEIENAKSQGDLRYLSNLDFQDGFYRATSSSQLTPSNL